MCLKPGGNSLAIDSVPHEQHRCLFSDEDELRAFFLLRVCLVLSSAAVRTLVILCAFMNPTCHSLFVVFCNGIAEAVGMI